MGNSTVNKTWKTINWKQAEEYVKRLQLRIVKATQQGKWRLVRRLQYLITHSFYVKALAVKKVISNKGKNTAGIDGVIWKTDSQKKQAIEQLNPNHYSPKAVKRIYITKFGKKRGLWVLHVCSTESCKPCMYKHWSQYQNALRTLTLMVLGDLKVPKMQEKKFLKFCADSTQLNGY